MPLRILSLSAITFAGFAAIAAPAAGQTAATAFTDPAEIDRAIIAFTGVPIGEVGGARMPADRRLRLAPCEGPLDLSWHGTSRSAVQVVCPGPQSWRIFIATRAPAPTAAATPIVSRGDPVTVVVRGRGFTVQQSGEALENGQAGDWIAIRTAPDSPPVRAQIERPGLAIIPAN